MVAKCLICRQLFALFEHLHAGTLEVGGHRFRVEICPACQSEMKHRKEKAQKEASA